MGWNPQNLGWASLSKRAASGAPAFTPASLTSLRLWVKSDTGITIATGVSQWDDLSGNANHLVQATGANQPVVTNSAINGLPAITFDGTNDFIKKAFTLAQPATVFIVFRQNTWTLNDQLYDGNGGDTMILSQSGGASPSLRIYGGAAYLTPTSDLAVGVFGLASAVYSGVSSSFQINNGTTVSGSGGSASPGGMTVAAGASGSFCADISVAEIIVMAATATAGERTSMRAYVTARYGIAM